MTLVSWAKKEMAKLKVQSSKRLQLPPPQTTFNTSLNCHVSSQESEFAADLRCTKCQEKVEALLSTIKDLESIVVHVVDKKVTFTRKPINN